MDKSEIYILGYDFEKISRYLFEIADEYRKSVDYNFEPDHMSERTQMCITEILDEFQMNKRWCGYQYHLEAIFLYLNTPTTAYKIMDVYALLAEKHHKNRMAIEHDMRNLLEHTWDRGNRKAMIRYFGNDYMRPKNKAFIVRIAEEVRLRTNPISYHS